VRKDESGETVNIGLQVCLEERGLYTVKGEKKMRGKCVKKKGDPGDACDVNNPR
jgi:hypothetical protein